MARRAALLLASWAVLVGGGCSSGGEGTAGSRARSVLPDTLALWVASGSVVLFDIQPDSLYERARLPLAAPAHGATVSDLRDLIPVDPTVPLVVYNTDGSPPPPGEDLAGAIAEYGFREIYWLEGGLQAWVARGYNVGGSRLFPDR
jgi:rhodanese-related sulfurtransferase